MEYFSWVMSAMSVLMLWQMGNKSKYAPVTGLVNQIMWIVYVIGTQQWGLMPGVIAFTVVHTRNLIKWNKE